MIRDFPFPWKTRRKPPQDIVPWRDRVPPSPPQDTGCRAVASFPLTATAQLCNSATAPSGARRPQALATQHE
jgi:hypothetical protein